MVPPVIRRALVLACVVLAAFGLSSPCGGFFVHAHEGGDDPHHHGHTLAQWFDHGHQHAAEPTDGGSPSPDDDDHHGHARVPSDAAFSRARGPALGIDAAGPSCAAIDAAGLVEVRTESSGCGLSRRDRHRGPPHAAARSTIERLIQGIGLRI